MGHGWCRACCAAACRVFGCVSAVGGAVNGGAALRFGVPSSFLMGCIEMAERHGGDTPPFDQSRICKPELCAPALGIGSTVTTWKSLPRRRTKRRAHAEYHNEVEPAADTLVPEIIFLRRRLDGPEKIAHFVREVFCARHLANSVVEFCCLLGRDLSRQVFTLPGCRQIPLHGQTSNTHFPGPTLITP